MTGLGWAFGLQIWQNCDDDADDDDDGDDGYNADDDDQMEENDENDDDVEKEESNIYIASLSCSSQKSRRSEEQL